MVLNSAIGQSVNLHSNESPLVSICIPVYNGEKYIRQTVESVLAQTYSNFELIINDDITTAKEAMVASARSLKYQQIERLSKIIQKW